MPYSLDDKLVVAITGRALFDLDEAHRIYEREGLEAYQKYQLQNEDVTLKPGTGYPLVQALLAINKRVPEPIVDVVLLTRNDAESGLRIIKSIETRGLSIARMAFTDGTNPYRYLESFSCDLFLSAHQDDVKDALEAGFAAALVYPPPSMLEEDLSEVRIAFDGDAVLFGGESERIFQEQGIDAFHEHETRWEDTPMTPGPFKGLLQAISTIQRLFPERDCPIRTALVTARGAPAHKRLVKTLRTWGVSINESFFMGGVNKAKVLRAFKPHIYFDDQALHLNDAAGSTPAAQVVPFPSTRPPGSQA
jgi:5'-nucleotidase